MKLRYLLPALLMGTLPLISHAEIEFSINVAPPVLPVYEQPPCPVEGNLWTPGYWGYGEFGYYWVPGVWIAPPRAGVLWTPGYWGFNNGIYAYNAGYWGPTVGYYGGVNYGFGYGGSGYGGGRWDGGAFRYNTAITNVNTTIIHNTYEDRTVIVNNAPAGRASFNGPGGVTARPTAAEEAAAKEPHIPATPVQLSNRTQAATRPGLRYKNNHGNPAPALAKADNAKPETKPEAKGPEAAGAKPEAGKPKTAEAKPEAGKPEATEAKPEAGKPEAAEAKPEAGKPETAEAKPKAAAKSADRPAKEEEKARTAPGEPRHPAETEHAASQKHAAEPAKVKATPEGHGEKEDKKKEPPQ